MSKQLSKGSSGRKTESLIQSIRDTFLTYEHAKNAVFWYVVYYYTTRALRFVRARGISTVVYDGYLWLARTILQLVLKFPAAKRKVNKELDKATKELEEKLAPTLPIPSHTALPADGYSPSWLSEQLEELASVGGEGLEWKKGKASGAVYHGGDEVSRVIIDAYSKFVITNPLHPDLFPGVRRMEAEVISMCLSMYNLPPSAGGCGTTTSGGTESIIMAVKAYREWARKEKGITEPEMVIPISAHAAFDKAAGYFKIRIHHIAVDPETRKVDVRAVKRAINKNTIMIVGSACNFPDGMIDNIPALGALAKKHNIGLHVDCCLGSFLVPFLEKAGFPTEPFDFRVEGVTSISCDVHKYGFAPKGMSVVMYRNKALRKNQYFVFAGWPGGVYASPSIAGSRPGALIAGTWATMMYIGESGYIASCQSIIMKAKKIEAAIRTIPELYVLGKPLVSVVAFASNGVDIYEVGDRMSKKGWHLNALQQPPAIHIAVTRLTPADQFITDLKDAVKESQGTPDGKGTMVTLYGLGASSAVGPGLVEEMSTRYLDTLYKV